MIITIFSCLTLRICPINGESVYHPDRFWDILEPARDHGLHDSLEDRVLGGVNHRVDAGITEDDRTGVRHEWVTVIEEKTHRKRRDAYKERADDQKHIFGDLQLAPVIAASTVELCRRVSGYYAPFAVVGVSVGVAVGVDDGVDATVTAVL